MAKSHAPQLRHSWRLAVARKQVQHLRALGGAANGSGSHPCHSVHTRRHLYLVPCGRLSHKHFGAIRNTRSATSHPKPTVYAVYAISSLDTGSPLRHRTQCNAVGTPQGVAGLAPRPFTLGEETGSHHMVMYIAPACSSACTSGAHLCICRPIGGHLSSSSTRAELSSNDAKTAPFLQPPILE